MVLTGVGVGGGMDIWSIGQPCTDDFIIFRLNGIHFQIPLYSYSAGGQIPTPTDPSLLTRNARGEIFIRAIIKSLGPQNLLREDEVRIESAAEIFSVSPKSTRFHHFFTGPDDIRFGLKSICCTHLNTK